MTKYPEGRAIRFSLGALLVAIVIMGIFAAALAYQTIYWVCIAVTMTVGILASVTLGLWMNSLNRRFWLPFAFVGWLHLLFALADPSLLRLPFSLLTTRLAFDLYFTLYPERIADMAAESGIIDAQSQALYLWMVGPGLILAFEQFARFQYFLHIVQSLFSLLLATLAGMLSTIINRAREIQPP